MLEAMDLYWRDHPPVHLMVAAYLGIKPQGQAVSSGQPIEEASQFLPVAALGKDEWDALMDQHGLSGIPHE